VNAAAYAGLDAALERERTGQTILLGTADAPRGCVLRGTPPPDFSGR
jgi:hypothetical protein